MALASARGMATVVERLLDEKYDPVGKVFDGDTVLISLCKNRLYGLAMRVIELYPSNMFQAEAGEIFTIACCHNNMKFMNLTHEFTNDSTYENKNGYEWITHNGLNIPWDITNNKMFDDYKVEELREISVDLYRRYRNLEKRNLYIRDICKYMCIGSSNIVCDYLE